MKNLTIAILTATVAGLLTTSTAGALEQQRHAIHSTAPAFPHPLPQGKPAFISGVEAKPIVALRFAIVDGRRVLVNARTHEIVYTLHP